MALVCVSLCVLVLAGALLHLAWRLALATLLLAPSGAGGIVAGWYVAQGSENVAFGIAAAVGAAALARFALLRFWAWLFAPLWVTLVAWTEAR